MKRRMKKPIVVLLMISVLLSLASFPISAEADIMPCYNNAKVINSSASISGNTLLISNQYSGISGQVTKAVITTYIEKQVLFFFWQRVDIDQPNNQWVDTVYQSSYNGSHTFKLPSNGTYRVTAIFHIEGSGPADDVTRENTVNY